MEIRNLANDKESHNKIINLVKSKLNDKNINAQKIFGELALIKKEKIEADSGRRSPLKRVN